MLFTLPSRGYHHVTCVLITPEMVYNGYDAVGRCSLGRFGTMMMRTHSYSPLLVIFNTASILFLLRIRPSQSRDELMAYLPFSCLRPSSLSTLCMLPLSLSLLYI